MKLAVITPVGPGHFGIVSAAIESVRVAQLHNTCWGFVKHVIVNDCEGLIGRSAARNQGMRDGFGWYFFLDADDTMRPDALNLAIPDAQAVFGSISLDGYKRAKNVYPCGWREIAQHGARGTLSMGFFCRAEVARRLRFNDALDAGEDFDFYLRLDDFVKIDRPLVNVGYDMPSAGGPRGYVDIPWIDICNDMIVAAVAREPAKYDIDCDAILAKAGDP